MMGTMIEGDSWDLSLHLLVAVPCRALYGQFVTRRSVYRPLLFDITRRPPRLPPSIILPVLLFRQFSRKLIAWWPSYGIPIKFRPTSLFRFLQSLRLSGWASS